MTWNHWILQENHGPCIWKNIQRILEYHQRDENINFDHKIDSGILELWNDISFDSCWHIAFSMVRIWRSLTKTRRWWRSTSASLVFAEIPTPESRIQSFRIFRSEHSCSLSLKQIHLTYLYIEIRFLWVSTTWLVNSWAIGTCGWSLQVKGWHDDIGMILVIQLNLWG